MPSRYSFEVHLLRRNRWHDSAARRLTPRPFLSCPILPRNVLLFPTLLCFLPLLFSRRRHYNSAARRRTPRPLARPILQKTIPFPLRLTEGRCIRRVGQMRALGIAKIGEFVEAGARFEAVFEAEGEYAQHVVADKVGAAVQGELLFAVIGGVLCA